MKKLELNQMQQVKGGCTPNAKKVMNWVAAVSLVGSAIPVVGLAMFAPMGVGAVVFNFVCD